jgi:hypothetical protein
VTGLRSGCSKSSQQTPDRRRLEKTTRENDLRDFAVVPELARRSGESLSPSGGLQDGHPDVRGSSHTSGPSEAARVAVEESCDAAEESLHLVLGRPASRRLRLTR